jgi:carbonic anhydrase/acetyltransferase-like protein (isoleucine patch superfamily)
MPLRGFASRRPHLDSTVFLDESAVVIGEVTVGAESSIWPQAVLRGDVGPIHIGCRTNIQDGCILHGTPVGPTSPHGDFVTIGDGVTVGHAAVLHGCTIGNDCLVGMRTVIMDGAVLGDGTVVGANSFVPAGMHLESGFLWVGNPVRRVRPLSDAEQALLHESAQHYVALAAQYREGAGG